MPQVFEVRPRKVPTFFFVGVTTGRSSILRVFPRWMREVGQTDVLLEGVDCQIHDRVEVYRRIVVQIKEDPLSLGALVTTHKIDLLDAARDLFDYLDPYACICGEVSSISKNKGCLEGHAKDPISAGLSLDAVIGQGYFARTRGDVLCFGAGGSAVATLLHLIRKEDRADRPARFVFVNRSQGRLDRARQMVSGMETDIEVEYVHNSVPTVNDRIMESMPPHSLVINATGMGKDTPGSPITWGGRFPTNSLAWEFNYRGELDFLHQAEAQAASRSVRVEDGWLYFVHGWTQVVAQVLHFDLNDETFSRLRLAADKIRQESGGPQSVD